MVEYILGNYLVDSGKITEEQLKEVLDKMDGVRVKLGLIAVSEGMMTLAQADEVNRLQAMEDKRFGDIAVEKGYLIEEQIGKLLKMQGNSYLMFAQVLVDAGHVSMEELDQLVNEFRQTKGYSNSEMDAIKSDDVERIVPLLLPEAGKSFAELAVITLKSVIRLIDRRTYVEAVEMTDSFPAKLQVSQALDGKDGLIDCFSECDGALVKVASIFGREEFKTVCEDSLDAAGEFLNCVNGLYVSGLSTQGKFLELMPPEYINVSNKAKSTICRMKIKVNDCSFYFTVAELA